MSFHTDLTTQMPAIVAVKNIYVKPPFPAWTAIQVSRLIPSNGITEIRIVAKQAKIVSGNGVATVTATPTGANLSASRTGRI
jgi:hypothetical protein